MPYRLNRSKKDATNKTRQINKDVYQSIDWNRVNTEIGLAKQGMLADAGFPVIDREDSAIPAWDLKPYQFLLNSNIPDTVNPKLWMQGVMNLNAGLFQVSENIYQVRAFDLANMTFIRGKTGWIVMDTLTCMETAEAAIAFVNRYFGEIPVSAVIITHSHVDHYGGSLGVLNFLANHGTPFYVPANYVASVVDENVYAGVAMSRRAKYQYGVELRKDEKGQIDCGIGKVVSVGAVTFSQNVVEIQADYEEKVVDGVRMEFLLALNTEAPSEMLVYLPDERSLCIAEDCNATLHNLLTLRGAKVRDPVAWANAIQKALDLWGSKITSVFGVHNWPRFENGPCIDYMEKQRDMYQYINDQTLRFINQGYTLEDVGRLVTVPESLRGEWYNNGFYGAVIHNAKAVYQRYLGWYSSNPVDLNKLFPEESARKYVEYMGGETNVLRKAARSFEAGDYQWVAEVTKQVIYANPENERAKLLCADALEQLGYVAESGAWRNEYLMGAWELRHGIIPAAGSYLTKGVIDNLPLKDILNLFSIRLNGPEAGDLDYKLNFIITDRNEAACTEVKRGIFRYLGAIPCEDAAVTVSMPKDVLYALTTTNDEPDSSRIIVEGDVQKWVLFLSLRDRINPDFSIMTPVQK